MLDRIIRYKQLISDCQDLNGHYRDFVRDEISAKERLYLGKHTIKRAIRPIRLHMEEILSFFFINLKHFMTPFQ